MRPPLSPQLIDLDSPLDLHGVAALVDPLLHGRRLTLIEVPMPPQEVAQTALASRLLHVSTLVMSIPML
jgi:hypothetical protein